jgi:hypothetical protein
VLDLLRPDTDVVIDDERAEYGRLVGQLTQLLILGVRPAAIAFELVQLSVDYSLPGQPDIPASTLMLGPEPGLLFIVRAALRTTALDIAMRADGVIHRG